MYSTLAYSLWNYITCFFDYIPKIMYFLYAAVASCLDAMQLLMRRLAGLDVYYVNRNTGGTIVSGTGTATTGDPVMEFIYGILGIGENAGSYQALNTTFWSLAIFAVIVLVVSTMIALIKSHYQEDGAKTAPLQYIYTAIKAILTFCIVPFAVIIGLMTSNFLLSTLDSITAGSGTEEALIGIYGSDALSKLNAHETEDGDKYYSRYDFFGFGAAANSTTFSGALFKATAYEANRIRIGEVGQDSGDGGVTGFYDFDGFFGAGSSGYTAATDKREYIAYQIDYAFQNNFDLKLSETNWAPIIYAGQKDSDGRNAFITISSIDVFGLAGIVTNFSKYNVGLVWAYYNLWKFNFMVGIASIIVCFGIFISIIIGLMSRLIKSIILFLIYAPTLGLAPMDEFGAFKKWRTEFMQQILMAFGSVIGMNIFFLVLPYINNIAFFNIYLIDAIVSIVVMVTGLMIIKSLISFFSGLVGGADALKEGDDLKGDVGKTLGSAAKGTMGLGKAAYMLNPVARMAISGAKGGIAMLNAKRLDKKAERLENELGSHGERDSARRLYKRALEENQEIDDQTLKAIENEDTTSAAYQEYKRSFAEHMRQNGGNEEAAAAAAKADALKEGRRGTRYDTNAKVIENKGFVKRRGESDKAFQKRVANYDASIEVSNRAAKVRESNYISKNDKGKWEFHLGEAMANDFRNAGGTLAKALLEGLLPALKIDPGKIAGIVRFASNKKYDDKGNFTGYYWAPKQYTAADRGTKLRYNPAGNLGKLSYLWGGNKVAKPDKSTEKQTLEATQENARIAEQSSKQQIKLLREILKKLP